MTPFGPYEGLPNQFAEFLIDASEYEKLLDADLKEFTNDLKNLSSERLKDSY